MNKMLIAVGVIFLVCMMIGYVRGFLRIVATMAATIATIVLVSLLLKRAMPKSVTLIVPSEISIIFCGFISLCTIPLS